MPNVGAGNKPIAFGDFSRAYTVVDRVNMSIMRDPFSQATSGNIRYVARRRLGGTVVLAEAIQLQNISS
jgi:HK97 family phage major capsid protein